MIKNRPVRLLGILFLCLIVLPGFSQKKKRKTSSTTVQFDESLYQALKWRSIGPYRGGRSAAVTGVKGKPNLFYFGSAGGGVWRSVDAGNSWQNISDGFFGGSIGAVAVSEWDNNVIYVGGGEKTVRGNVSYGYGVWKTMDAGKTWVQSGLENSRHISRIRIHPKNPDLVYAAVMGDLFKSTEERGVYRSKDGGKTWERVLFANADAGAVDLIMDPNNPRILFASTWRIRRTPYSLESGGDGSSLWKSVDGGDTWTNISKNKGLPDGLWGISGVTVSPVNSNRVWAIIENDKGGVYRSDDGGETWARINESRALRQRAWYYSRIYADTQNEDMVYVVNVRYHRSKDGGKTFEPFVAPHGDHHDLWIDPENSSRMIIGDDGGAQVSFDGGENWTTYHNQPTAQFYRVTTDNHFPYRVYGAQQDNSTVRIAHRTESASITEQDWERSAGGESAHLAIDPTDNDVVYGGSYGGFLTRVNHRTKEIRGINVWPDNPMGHGAEGMKYRFQWNFPIFFSPHDPRKLYAASNHLHVSYNGGETWEVISPDLTTNDPSKLGPSGGPITKDNTGVEYYCTIFAAAESPYEKDLIWTGSDDGLVHISKDGGKNWSNVTPSVFPKDLMINSIDPDPFVKGGAYVAGTRYKSGDYRPYLFKTKDYGQTWTQITSGIDAAHFTRVVRADPERQGLLYAGTETGMYISFDDGASWKAFNLNLPIVPITDLTIKDNNLIAATQGRSFWLIDDLTPLHQLESGISNSAVHVFEPKPSYRMRAAGSYSAPPMGGENHPEGVMIHYYLKDEPAEGDTLEITLMEEDGDPIVTFTNFPEKEDSPYAIKEVEKGMNILVWNMRYKSAEKFDGMILWAATLNGPKAVPGKYKVSASIGDQMSEADFDILKDPRSTASQQDLQEQFDFLQSVIGHLNKTNRSVGNIRKARTQIETVTSRLKDAEGMEDVMKSSEQILEKLRTIEEALYQTKNQSNQDPLNFPIRLNNKLGHLNSLSGYGDYKPTDSAKEFFAEITAEIDKQLEELSVVFNTDIPEFNQLVRNKQIDAVILDTE